MPFIYLMVPGMNVVVILIAISMDSFLITFLTLYTTILIWILLSYFTYEKLFVARFIKEFKKEKTYKVLKIWYKEGPLKMALLVR